MDWFLMAIHLFYRTCHIHSQLITDGKGTIQCKLCLLNHNHSHAFILMMHHQEQPEVQYFA